MPRELTTGDKIGAYFLLALFILAPITLVSAVAYGGIKEEYVLQTFAELIDETNATNAKFNIGDIIQVSKKREVELNTVEKIESAPALAIGNFIGMFFGLRDDDGIFHITVETTYPDKNIQYTGTKDGKYEFYDGESNRFMYLDKSNPILELGVLGFKINNIDESMTIDGRWVQNDGGG